jgi:hypothetical protein
MYTQILGPGMSTVLLVALRIEAYLEFRPLTLNRDSLSAQENFSDLTFVDPAMMHLSMNPDYFNGTVVADAAAALVRQAAPSAQPL